ncbi:MAG TPA: hypothetical protein PLD10_03645 [Rhodopila sp.]|nr:hypothetical protein [Rhodopila sp.]
MTASQTALPKGLRMIAAYRAERLKQRPVLRTALHASHVARRAARSNEVPAEHDAAGPQPVDTHTVQTMAETPTAGSVFASLVNRAAVEPTVPDHLAQAGPAIDGPEELEKAAPAATDAAVTRTAAYDPPLAEIGFGPGMLIRLSQLGLHTTADLARADAQQLRAELGEISRLVDVEAWICHARQNSDCR